MDSVQRVKRSIDPCDTEYLCKPPVQRISDARTAVEQRIGHGAESNSPEDDLKRVS
jgi:hypothetical protein